MLSYWALGEFLLRFDRQLHHMVWKWSWEEISFFKRKISSSKIRIKKNKISCSLYIRISFQKNLIYFKFYFYTTWCRSWSFQEKFLQVLIEITFFISHSLKMKNQIFHLFFLLKKFYILISKLWSGILIGLIFNIVNYTGFSTR